MTNNESGDLPFGSTKEKGDSFEKEVADVFRLIPRATVSQHTKIAGKDVDIYVVLQGPLSSETRIAIDAKDYGRPLSRERADREYSSYYPLVTNNQVDQIIIVTRHGIVANAKEIFDGKKAKHFTIAELRTYIFDPNRLIDDMESQFSSGKLNEYYVDTQCYNIDIGNAYENYDLYYSDFVAFALSKGVTDFEDAKNRWKQESNQPLTGRYTKDTFKRAIEFRKGPGEPTTLEPLVDKWLNSPTLKVGIALLGTYGTGKSCFARRIAHKAAIDFKSGKSGRIPLLIELKDFGSHQSIEGLITHTLVNRHGLSNGSYSLFKKMNSSGSYFLILDGFDEMKQGLTKDALIYNFNELNSLCEGDARVLLCGRPTMFASEEEQTAVLAGGAIAEIPTRARYIPIEIAPIQPEAIMNMMISYVKALEPQQVAAFMARVESLRAGLENSELASLLSRPVHIPMFVTILPEYDGDINKLSRAYLYEAFIRKAISREVTRLNPAYQRRYSMDERLWFAGALALEMAKLGEVRSIRRSEIPSSIVSPFVKEGDSDEVAKRDLVAACFLEQKAPDILTFAHKSFLEFLVAHYSLSIIRGQVPKQSPRSLIYPTEEIASFFLDIVRVADLTTTISTQPDGTWDFILSCILRLSWQAMIQSMQSSDFTIPVSGIFRYLLPFRFFFRQKDTNTEDNKEDNKFVTLIDHILGEHIMERATKVDWPQKNWKDFGRIITVGAFLYRSDTQKRPRVFRDLESQMGNIMAIVGPAVGDQARFSSALRSITQDQHSLLFSRLARQQDDLAEIFKEILVQPEPFDKVLAAG